ncbi:MAG: acyltransferase [Oceanicaulis sp.]
MKTKLEWIQGLRAVAAGLVLLAHLFQQDNRFLSGALSPIWTTAGVSGVDLFFVISGFVMVYVTRHAPHGSAPFAARFLYARVTRIYPAYWLATLGVIAGYMVMGGALTRDAGELNYLSSFLLWPEADLPILIVGWTLIHEVYFYLVFTALLFAPRRFLPLLLGVWLAVAALAGFAAGPGAAPELLLITHPLTAEFVMGCAAGLLITSGRRAFAPVFIATGIVWWIAATGLVDWSSPANLPRGWDRVLAWGVPAALVVYGVACIDVDLKARAPRALVAVGDWSYALYLVHLPIVAALARVWARVFPDSGWVSSLAYLIVGAGLSLIAAAAMHHLFEKPVLALTRKAGDRILPAARPVASTPREATKIW